ncbi:MAG: 4Fe-4S dicluster domain-containing protein [Planctomycetaceae bacterium]|jgi:Na+-translocating ferredoxin:NAD+ oxidoreductase RnfC subunit|nr:4Fe-4S dicluster domain-containing protein [Planctomycetaceae bacterium]
MLNKLAESGVVGAGGAGFPTHIKLSGKADTAVINAAECEPLLHKDKEIILAMPERIAAGLQMAMQLTGAARGIIGIKKKYPRVIETLQKVLPQSMSVHPLDDAYPAGDEFILVYETLGRVIPPGAIPLAVGAVVMNVETALNAANAAEGIPVTEKYVSVAGEVEHPCTLKVPLGTPLFQLLDVCNVDRNKDYCYIVGGAMMGYIETDLTKPVTKTTGGILVLPKGHFIAGRKSWDWRRISRIGKSACDQCSFCTERCPRYLLGHPVEPHKAMRGLGFSRSISEKRSFVPGSQFCCECNLCSYVSCPEGLDPRSVCSENKQRMAAEKIRYENPPFNPRRADSMMLNRKTPTQRLMTKIGLAKYTNKAPLEQRTLDVRCVVIPLKQHIGAVCIPAVSAGERVRKGQVIAKRPIADGKAALGADIHSSIDGTVKSVDNGALTIGNE